MLHFAHLADASDPVMLIWGDRRALDALAALIEHADGAAISIDATGPGRIAIDVSDAGGGVRQASGSEYRWSIRRDTRGRFADLVRAVAFSETASHHYLDDAEGRGLAVKVSKGEYPDNFLACPPTGRRQGRIPPRLGPTPPRAS